MSDSDPVTHIMIDYDNEIEFISNLLAAGLVLLMYSRSYIIISIKTAVS